MSLFDLPKEMVAKEIVERLKGIHTLPYVCKELSYVPEPIYNPIILLTSGHHNILNYLLQTGRVGNLPNIPEVKGVKASMRRLYRKSNCFEFRMGDRTYRKIPDLVANNFSYFVKVMLNYKLDTARNPIMDKTPFMRYIEKLVDPMTPGTKISTANILLFQLYYEDTILDLLTKTAILVKETEREGSSKIVDEQMLKSIIMG